MYETELENYDPEILAHFGIKGQKWGLRRFQNEDGSLTPAGIERYRKHTDTINKLNKKYEKQDAITKQHNAKSDAILNSSSISNPLSKKMAKACLNETSKAAKSQTKAFAIAKKGMKECEKIEREFGKGYTKDLYENVFMFKEEKYGLNINGASDKAYAQRTFGTKVKTDQSTKNNGNSVRTLSANNYNTGKEVIHYIRFSPTGQISQVSLENNIGTSNSASTEQKKKTETIHYIRF